MTGRKNPFQPQYSKIYIHESSRFEIKSRRVARCRTKIHKSPRGESVARALCAPRFRTISYFRREGHVRAHQRFEEKEGLLSRVCIYIYAHPTLVLIFFIFKMICRLCYSILLLYRVRYRYYKVNNTDTDLIYSQ